MTKPKFQPTTNTRTKTFVRCLAILFTFFVSIISTAIEAAEIRLTSEPIYCSNTVVTLNDIAEVLPKPGEDAEQLKRTVLFTAPGAGEEKHVSMIELRNVLSRMGLTSIQHPLTGARIVVLYGLEKSQQFVTVSTSKASTSNVVTAAYVSREVDTVTEKKAMTPSFVRLLESQLSEAIIVYLEQRTVGMVPDTRPEPKSKRVSWKVSLTLTDEQARKLSSGGQIEEIAEVAVSTPKTRRFEIYMQQIDSETNRAVRVQVDAQVKTEQEVAVARRAFPRGYIISRSDITIIATDQNLSEEFFTDSSELAGMETIGAVREGSILTPKMVKMPTWVRKGDVVTVRSVNGGIVVRTNAIAQQDGVQGDTIAVETIDRDAKVRGNKNKHETATFLARVSEPKTVEVNATPMIVGMER